MNEIIANDILRNAPRGDARTDRPQILFVIGQLTVGGTENHLAMVAPPLVRKGWRVCVYPLAGNGPLGAILEAGGIEIIKPPIERRAHPQNIALRCLRLALASGKLLTTLIRRKPVIVHFFLPAAYLIGAPLAALASSPIRIMSRRSLNVYQESHPWLSRFERRMHLGMTAVLGNSRSIIRELKDQESVPAQKLGLIYNGLDLSRFAYPGTRQQARGHLGIAPDELVIVTVANLIPYKGHADLLNALGRIKTRLPDKWRLLVVGRDDGIGPDLKRQSADLGLSGHVDFMGSRDDVPRLLAAADVGVLCSHQEGFSNAILEGMAAGLPMTVTNVGGNTEAIQHETTGLIVPPNDPDQLAQALIRLASDPDLRGRLGKAARERIFNNFTLDRCVDAYDALYRALLDGRPASDVAEIQIRG
jgi:glycosyltransferase involved in cell wall biosynthesis